MIDLKTCNRFLNLPSNQDKILKKSPYNILLSENDHSSYIPLVIFLFHLLIFQALLCYSVTRIYDYAKSEFKISPKLLPNLYIRHMYTLYMPYT